MLALDGSFKYHARIMSTGAISMEGVTSMCSSGLDLGWPASNDYCGKDNLVKVAGVEYDLNSPEALQSAVLNVGLSYSRSILGSWALVSAAAASMDSPGGNFDMGAIRDIARIEGDHDFAELSLGRWQYPGIRKKMTDYGIAKEVGDDSLVLTPLGWQVARLATWSLEASLMGDSEIDPTPLLLRVLGSSNMVLEDIANPINTLRHESTLIFLGLLPHMKSMTVAEMGSFYEEFCRPMGSTISTKGVRSNLERFCGQDMLEPVREGSYIPGKLPVYRFTRDHDLIPSKEAFRHFAGGGARLNAHTYEFLTAPDNRFIAGLGPAELLDGIASKLGNSPESWSSKDDIWEARVILGNLHRRGLLDLVEPGTRSISDYRITDFGYWAIRSSCEIPGVDESPSPEAVDRIISDSRTRETLRVISSYKV